MVWLVLWSLVIALATFLFHVAPDWSGIQSIRPDVMRATSTMMKQNWQDMILTIVCAIGVFAYFFSRFNAWPEVGQRPTTFPEHQPRFFTTWTRYSVWAFFYGALLSSLFLLIVLAPEFFEQILGLLDLAFPSNTIFGAGGTNILAPSNLGGEHVWFLGTGLLVAGFFATSDFEKQLRNFFQIRAMIPYEAERIFSQLEGDYYSYPVHRYGPHEDYEGELDSRETVKDFLADSSFDRTLPTYFEFELQVEREQELQRRLELLPRVEFMFWRLKKRGFSAEIDAELVKHDAKLDEIEKTIAPLRETAQRINDQLVAAVEGLRAIEDAAEQISISLSAKSSGESARLGSYARVLAAANLDPRPGKLCDIPVSRLDDVAEALDRELEVLGIRLAELNSSAFGALKNVAPTADTTPAEVVVRLIEAVSELRGQTQSLLGGLTPLCGFGLKSINDTLGEREPLVKLASAQLLGYAICIALAASRRPDRSFFSALGLWPRLGTVKFRTDFALRFVVGQILLFFILVFAIYYLLDPSWWEKQAWVPDWAPINKFIDGLSNSEPINAIVWLSVGGWFIAHALLHGCYHGSALASLRELRPGKHSQPKNFRWLEAIAAYVMIWSVSVIGLFILTTAMNDAGLFSGSVYYTIVPPVWGVLVAAATMRVSLDMKPIKLPRDAVWSLLATCGSLWIVMQVTGSSNGSTPSPIMTAVIYIFGCILNLSILFVISKSFEKKDEEIYQPTKDLPVFQSHKVVEPTAAE